MNCKNNAWSHQVSVAASSLDRPESLVTAASLRISSEPQGLAKMPLKHLRQNRVALLHERSPFIESPHHTLRKTSACCRVNSQLLSCKQSIPLFTRNTAVYTAVLDSHCVCSRALLTGWARGGRQWTVISRDVREIFESEAQNSSRTEAMFEWRHWGAIKHAQNERLAALSRAERRHLGLSRSKWRHLRLSRTEDQGRARRHSSLTCGRNSVGYDKLRGFVFNHTPDYAE